MIATQELIAAIAEIRKLRAENERLRADAAQADRQLGVEGACSLTRWPIEARARSAGRDAA